MASRLFVPFIVGDVRQILLQALPLVNSSCTGHLFSKAFSSCAEIFLLVGAADIQTGLRDCGHHRPNVRGHEVLERHIDTDALTSGMRANTQPEFMQGSPPSDSEL